MHVKPHTIMHNVYGVIPGLSMLAGIKLDLFSRLRGCPMTSDRLAEAMDVQEKKLSPLLYALVAAGLLKVKDEVFSNTDEAETYLCGGQRCNKEHVAFLTCRLLSEVSKTAETITQNNPQSSQDWSDLSHQEAMRLFREQYPVSLQAGKELAKKIDLSFAKRILDCAGGSGGLAIGLCETFRDITVTIADLPEMISFTQKYVSKAGMADRIKVIAADILRGAPAGQYDAAIVRSFIQVLSPENAEKAIKHIGKALVPGAMISIVGHFLDDTRLFPLESVAHNLLFLNVYEDGRAYTESEYRQWLGSAGFEDIRVEHSVFSEGAGLITARKE